MPREAMAAGLIGFTAGHRDRRGDGQRLLLRAVWLARQPLHVQRRVGRLVRRSRGRARGLVRQPRGRARGLRGPSRGYGRLATASGRRMPRSNAATGQSTRPAAADRATAERPVVPASTAQTARSSGGTSTSARATGQAATPTTQSASGGTSSYQARGQNRDRSSTAAERSGTESDAFSNYSSGKSERSASARGQSSRSGGGGGGGGEPAAVEAGGDDRRSTRPTQLIWPRRWRSLIACLSVAACTRPPEDRRYATAEDAARDPDRNGQEGEPRRAARALRSRGQELVASSDAGDRPAEPRGVRGGSGPAVAARRSRRRHEGAGRRQRGLAVSHPAREGRARLAVRHRGRKGRSPGAANRPQRAGRHRHLPRLRRRPSVPTREAGTTASPPASIARKFNSEPGAAQRLVLAGKARRAAQPAGRPRRGRGR